MMLARFSSTKSHCRCRHHTTMTKKMTQDQDKVTGPWGRLMIKFSPATIIHNIFNFSIVAAVVGIVIVVTAADAASEDPPTIIPGECDGTADQILNAAAFRLMLPSLPYLRASEVGTLQAIDMDSTSFLPELLSISTSTHGTHHFTLSQLLTSFLQHCGRYVLLLLKNILGYYMLITT